MFYIFPGKKSDLLKSSHNKQETLKHWGLLLLLNHETDLKLHFTDNLSLHFHPSQNYAAWMVPYEENSGDNSHHSEIYNLVPYQVSRFHTTFFFFLAPFSLFFFNFLIFFSFIFISWRLITSQHCSGSILLF